MKILADMYSFSSKLWYERRRVSKNGEASMCLQVVMHGDHKPFPLKFRWPINKVDLVEGKVLPRYPGDPHVNDYNLIIKKELSKHTEIVLKYRLKEQPIDLEIFRGEVLVFDKRGTFLSYMFDKLKYRYSIRDIAKRTYQNGMSAIELMLEFDKNWLFAKLNVKWMKRFKLFLLNDGFDPGYVWTTIKNIKCYVELASHEVMLNVNKEVVKFPNPEPQWRTTYLNKEEVRRLLILHRDDYLEPTQKNVLKAFLYQCFTSLRISDVYRVNSKWNVKDGFLDFIPKKNEKLHRWVHIPIMPLANTLINEVMSTYFQLPTEGYYNKCLKEIAILADIRIELTSHVGRHTFGYLYMTKVGNLKGLQEIMGHAKIETTMRYAHLDDEYRTISVKNIQDDFSDLLLRKIK